MFLASIKPNQDLRDYPFSNLINFLDVSLSSAEENLPDFRALLPAAKIIYSCRSKSFGGPFSGSDKEQLEILKNTVSLKPDFIEIENVPSHLDFVDSCRNQNFILTFASSLQLLDYLKSSDQRPNIKILRFTPKAECFADNLAIKDLLTSFGKTDKIISFATGHAGLVSRVMTHTWGGYLFPLPSAEDFQANDYTDIYYKSILETDLKFNYLLGIAGNPVNHSLSPLIHNYLFARNRWKGVYLPFRVVDFEPFFDFALKAGIYGLSVTMPHKDSAFRLASSSAGNISDKVKAANTLKLNSGEFFCLNTDGPGFCDALKNRIKLNNSDILVIGAGGAGRPIITSLLAEGANVFLAARSSIKEVEVSLQLGCKLHQGNQGKVKYKAVINTTPVAESHEDVTGFLAGLIPCGALAADLHYSPAMPYFLKEAERNRCRTMNGLDMLLYQAVRQFEFWFPGLNKTEFAELKEYVLNRIY